MAIAAEPKDDQLSESSIIPTWDEYFHEIAMAVARKSKDPRSKVGAVVVSPDEVILSTGYNGLPRGVHDDPRILHSRDEKLRLICHAEFNAVMNAARIGVSLVDSTIYVTKFPCLSCCNVIVQAGLSRIVTYANSYWNGDPNDKDHRRKKIVLQQAGIKLYAPNHPEYRVVDVSASDDIKESWKGKTGENEPHES